ncbi:Aa-trans domain-containing protein [Fusarium keratoplasticum]|nr:Aa-trans domain-containing protein [Fusarium keratoplasticum]
MPQSSVPIAEKDMMKRDPAQDIEFNGGLAPAPSQMGECQDTTQDAIFGEISEDGPNYRSVGWIGTVALMMKTQIGLGVLSIPAVFDTLGIVPGVICLCAVSAITTWSDYIVSVFKLRHPEVYSIDDAGFLMFGRIGREFLGIAFCLFFVVTIAVGIQDRPDAAPREGSWESDFKITNNPSFTEAISAVSALVFAYACTPALFSIASEMREPQHFTRALLVCQGAVTAIYIAIGCVVYYFCGSYVATPALGSAGVTVKKIAYGLALPGLIATTTLMIHFAAKYTFVRILRGSRHLASNSAIHWGTWLSCTLGTTIIAYLIASGIPVFGGLVSLIGALLGTLMSFQPMGCMWLYDNWTAGRKNPSVWWALMVVWSVFVIISGTFLMVGGTYGSVVGIVDSYESSGGSVPWSCADNSNSV